MEWDDVEPESDEAAGALWDAGHTGITRAAARGERTVYRLSGQSGLSRLSFRATASSVEPAAFRARLVSVPLGDIGYEEFTATSCSFDRTAAHVASDRLDDVRVSVLHDGVVNLDVDGARFRLEPGDVYVVDLARPYYADFIGTTRQSSVVVPRRLLRLIEGKIDLVRQQPVSVSALSEAFVGVLSGLGKRVPDDNTVDAELLAHALVDLVQGVSRTRDRGIGIDHEDVVIRRRVYALIEREFQLPGFNTSDVAARLRVSLRYLYRLFATEPYSVAQLLRARRVREIQIGLAGSAERFDSIARQAGFGSIDAAYRAFKDLTGVTPSEYRLDPASVPLLLPDHS
ncbi:helix-turn-helix domain-containing protein [Leucobacter sp. NPDC058333]|uniref:AraC-like ligand-binding domain-containing protein n=1 Tax=Leucobacter sp. NPDC058333 TaxID=3346450 RepID=UPI0036669758